MATLNYHRQDTGEPLLLAHGIGSRWQVWLPVLERLAAERDVIAVDLPGFGASPPSPPGTPPGIASLTDALERFLDDLGIDTAHIGGNSLGGAAALELAKRGRGGEAIDVPVTIAWGQRDFVLIPRQGRRAVRAIPGARLVTLRGCGHVPTYDDPRLVAEVLLAGSRPAPILASTIATS